MRSRGSGPRRPTFPAKCTRTGALRAAGRAGRRRHRELAEAKSLGVERPVADFHAVRALGPDVGFTAVVPWAAAVVQVLDTPRILERVGIVEVGAALGIAFEQLVEGFGVLPVFARIGLA